MRAIVTGGAGFIGSHLVEALLARGDEVHVADNLSTGARENVASAATLHELDIRDEALEQLAHRVRPEVVFHLAAQADVGTSIERPTLDADVNVVGTVRVLEAARATDARVVFASSGGAIYGDCERPAQEDDEPSNAGKSTKPANDTITCAMARLSDLGHRRGSNWNDDPKPFVWHKTADQILDSLATYCQRINDSGH